MRKESTARRNWRWRFGPILVGVGAAGLAGLVGLAAWLAESPNFKEHVRRQVRAGIPAGTSAEEAEAWIAQRSETRPVRSAATQPVHRLGGRSIAQLTGVRPAGAGEVICFTVRDYDSPNRLREQAWVYPLLDRDRRVVGHYLFTSAEH